VSNPTNRHQELKAILDRLKLSGMAKHFPDLALRAAKEGLSHEAYLHELARQEEALRQERRTERLLRQSGLPVEKTFRTFEPLAALCHAPTPDRATQTWCLPRACGECSLRWENQALEKATFSPHLGMNSSCLVMPSCGRPQAPSCNASSPPNGTCACPRSWPSWTNMPVSSLMIWATFSMIATKWRCSSRFFPSAMNANQC
jgi:hypothetical protein